MTKNYCLAILYNNRAGWGREESCVVFVIFLSPLFFPFCYWRWKLQRLEINGKALKGKEMKKEEGDTMQQYKSNLNYLSLLNTARRQKSYCTALEEFGCVCVAGVPFTKHRHLLLPRPKNNTTPVTRCHFVYKGTVDRVCVCVSHSI